MHIRNPIEWLFRAPADAAAAIGDTPAQQYWENGRAQGPPRLRRIGRADIAWALRRGLEDFKDHRADALVLVLLYPLAGAVCAAAVGDGGRLSLLVPLVAGLALIFPLLTTWLAECSRRREERGPEGHAGFADALGIFRSPQIGAIAALGLLEILLLLAWIASAYAIYQAFVGPLAPADFASLVGDLLGTRAGLEMLLVGSAAGLAFGLLALAIGSVSFPLLLDRHVGIQTAIRVPVAAVLTNPGGVLAWAGTVLALLVLGALPALLGLAVTLPILGHATWHLYRRMVV